MYRIEYWLHYTTEGAKPRRIRRSFGPDKGKAMKRGMDMPAWRNPEVVAVTTATIWSSGGNL